ncbi:hypothetical protein [Aliarcobacter butzleri]|uniref:hypothetical protein n=1 Tax=Aliarcobacter butzleri TaxID=28197 RepID=UPI00344DC8FB
MNGYIFYFIIIYVIIKPNIEVRLMVGYNKNRVLSSLVVMKELYNVKKDVYDVISEFIKEIILTQGKMGFNLIEITALINKEYDFNIPEAIVKTALKRLDFITLDNHSYYVNFKNQLVNSNLTDRHKDIKIIHEKLLNSLFDFISERENKVIVGRDKIKIIHSFTSFLLDETISNGYSDLVSGFILMNKDDKEFIKSLNSIKEGVVLYSGIRYSPNINNIGSWKNNLDIYLSTEILFSAIGYNGELYKHIFDDFYKLVKEINNQNKVIKLKYFYETKKEIDYFFKQAENLLEQPIKVNPSKSAMVSILDGCLQKSDIIVKKTKFDEFLENHGILLDTKEDYIDEKNYQYNIIDNEMVLKFSEKFSTNPDEINSCATFINKINILREEKNNTSLENLTHILLTNNSKILSMAWNDEDKCKTKMPHAVDISFLTNKFWFKLNKGFGSEELPKSFDVITKAQIIMSAHLNENIGKQYDKFQNEIIDGKLSNDSMIKTISTLRTTVRKPEEIINEDINIILDTIKEEDIQNHVKQNEYYKQKAKFQSEENFKLKYDIENKNTLLEIEKKDKINTKKELLKSKNEIYNNLIELKTTADSIIDKKYRNFKIIIATGFILYYAFFIFSALFYDWGEMEKFIWVAFILPLLFSLLYKFLTEKNFDILNIFNEKKNSIREKQLSYFKIDLSKLESLEKEIKELKQEISNS